MASLHARMPVIVAPDDWDLWLDPATDTAELLALLRPFDGDLVAGPVSALVNNPRNDQPELIEPLG